MVAKQRAVDRGDFRGRSQLRAIGAEIRLARSRLGLSLARVARECGISGSELSRIERGLAEWVSLLTLARTCAVVGLDLAARAYPGSTPLRDARHGKTLEKLHGKVHQSLDWGVEVTLASRTDQRAWDAMIRGRDWRFGVECELNPLDGQALLRRLHLKERDGAVDGLILLLPDTRQTRLFRREFAEQLALEFPLSAAKALRALSSGVRPAANALIVI